MVDKKVIAISFRISFISISAIICLLFWSAQLVSAIDIRALSGERLMVNPFTSDDSPNAEMVAGQAGFVLRRQLRAGRFVLPEIRERTWNEHPVTWENRREIDMFFKQESLDWFVSGHVENISRNPDGQNPGNRFIGISAIPVRADITVKLFDCKNGADIGSQTFQADLSVPRLRLFGLGKSPYPATIKAVDAFVHNAMLKASRQIMSAIINQKSEVLHHE